MALNLASLRYAGAAAFSLAAAGLLACGGSGGKGGGDAGALAAGVVGVSEPSAGTFTSAGMETCPQGLQAPIGTAALKCVTGSFKGQVWEAATQTLTSRECQVLIEASGLSRIWIEEALVAQHQIDFRNAMKFDNEDTPVRKAGSYYSRSDLKIQLESVDANRKQFAVIALPPTAKVKNWSLTAALYQDAESESYEGSVSCSVSVS